MPDRLLFLAVCAVWLGSELWIDRRRSGNVGRSRDQGTLRLLHAIVAGAIFLALVVSYLGYGRLETHRQALYASGIAMMIAGLALRWWSIRVLDRFFTVDVAIRDDHRLVRDGPYRWVRHPSYSGALLTFYGFALALGNAWSLAVIVLAVTPAFVRRIFVEEAVLRNAFPNDYADYARRTWRLIPLIW